METKSVVVISRKWHEIPIRAYVTQEEIGMRLWLNDYLQALVKEVGNPALILTQKQLLDKMRAAAERVETEVKQASRAVV